MRNRSAVDSDIFQMSVTKPRVLFAGGELLTLVFWLFDPSWSCSISIIFPANYVKVLSLHLLRSWRAALCPHVTCYHRTLCCLLGFFFPQNLCSLCAPKEICYLIICFSRMQVCGISLPALDIHLLCIINSHLKIHIYQFFKLNRSNSTPVVYFKSQSSSPQKTPTSSLH